MPEDRYLAARLLERCAIKYGESTRDARTLAIDLLAGRAHKPVPQAKLDELVEAAAEAEREARDPAVKAAAVANAQPAAAPPSPVEAPEAAVADAPQAAPAGMPPGLPAAMPAPDGSAPKPRPIGEEPKAGEDDGEPIGARLIPPGAPAPPAAGPAALGASAHNHPHVPQVAGAAPGSAAPAAAPAAPPEGMTPAGRPGLGPPDAEWIARYDRAQAVAKDRPDIQARLEQAVQGCMYASELGLLDEERVGRFIRTTVAITCEEDKHRGPDGQVDGLAHAQAAVGIFRENNFEARQFAEWGLIMARFAEMDKRVHDARRAACPDPREAELQRFQRGVWQGRLSGGRTGELALQASDGGLLGEVRVRAAAGKGAGKPASSGQGDASEQRPPDLVLKARGAISANRVHLFAVDDLQWLRLDGQRVGEVFEGKWQAEIGFTKTSGRFTLARPAPTPPPPAPAKP